LCSQTFLRIDLLAAPDFWRFGIDQRKGQQWISQRLCFGRFLAFSENRTDCSKLSEGKFRQYWERSESPSERHPLPPRRARHGPRVRRRQRGR
jgi:hypothetical protein